MSDAEVADKPETEQSQEESLFFTEEKGFGVSEEQDTIAEQEQAEPESQQQQDSSEEAEIAEAEVEGQEVSDSQDQDSQPEEIDPKDNPEAFQHWQSKYQKAESRLGFKPEELSDDEGELLRTLRQNPDYLQEFIEYKQNGSQQQAQQRDSQPEESKAKTLEKPTKPEKPEGYNQYEAYNDPDSESAQYLQAKEQYLEQMAEYNEQLAKGVREEVEEKEKTRQQQIEQAQRKHAWKSHLVEKEGFTEDQFSQFWQWKDKEAFTPEETIKMFKAVNGIDDKTPEKPKQQTKPSKAATAPSPGTAGGASKQRPSAKSNQEDDQLFSYR